MCRKAGSFVARTIIDFNKKEHSNPNGLCVIALNSCVDVLCSYRRRQLSVIERSVAQHTSLRGVASLR